MDEYCVSAMGKKRTSNANFFYLFAILLVTIDQIPG